MVRILGAVGGVLIAVFIGYLVWTPGGQLDQEDRGFQHNGLWLQHGWFGNDEWFRRDGKESLVDQVRSSSGIQTLAALLRRNHITDVFPHVAPADANGALPAVDHEQIERVLNSLDGVRVLPWTGGVIGKTVQIHDPQWFHRFIESILELLKRHPRLAGVHINIEPWPSGNRELLEFLKKLRKALPPDKILSVAAYPPPTWVHPFPEVHWDRTYYREISQVADQIVVMMYDTALPLEKGYQWLMKRWTRQVLDWTDGADVLLGIPTYDDIGVGYHNPNVENIENAIAGIAAGLLSYTTIPRQLQGLAIYSEWETDPREWAYWQTHFLPP